ncbi:MAG: M14 family metallopeptidase [Planctomycetia bacterium]
MNTCCLRWRWLAALALVAGVLRPGVPAVRAEGPGAREALPLAFDRYRDAAGLEAALRALHEAWPRDTTLASMGSSREGRPLWVLKVFDGAAGDPDAKPAFYVDGNTHGNEVQGTEACLFLAQRLLADPDPWVRGLRARVTFHVAPCVNPDSRERYLHAAHDEHSPRAVLRPVDDDRDGRADEDGPDDIDGDGQILQMRVADPDGDLVTDERDGRLMRARKPGERGQWRLLGSEGTDEDGDGRLNEDPVGGVDPNRNWPGNWRPEAEQGGAGPYPLSEPETRATALYLLGLEHISGVQSFHNAGRMILRPPAAFTDREADLPGEDRRVLDEVGRRGLVVLPTYRYMQIREDLYRVFGGFVDWAYVDLGVTAFTNELWGGIGRELVDLARAGKPGGEPDEQLAALRFNDVALHGRGFVRWKPVPHPRHGTVELGGWVRFTTRSDPPEFLHETCARNAMFVLDHADQLPELVVAGAQRGAQGEVQVVVENRRTLPTVHGMALRHGVLPPDRVRLPGTRLRAALWVGPDGAEPLPVRGDAALLARGVPGQGRAVLRLFPEGEAREVRVESRVGGQARAEVRDQAR